MDTFLQQLVNGLTDEVARNVATLEKELGKKFGDTKNPLLVSVRSGARSTARTRSARTRRSGTGRRRARLAPGECNNQLAAGSTKGCRRCWQTKNSGLKTNPEFVSSSEFQVSR